jgi:hypothetical protein
MKRTKYNSSKVEFQGITFDSKQEFDFYLELLSQKERGEISEIQLQPKFELLPKYEYQGKKKQGISYTADFAVVKNGELVIFDVKGMETQQGNMRRKMFEQKYPKYNLVWVVKNSKYCTDGTGFVEYDLLKKIRSKNKKMKAGTEK